MLYPALLNSPNTIQYRYLVYALRVCTQRKNRISARLEFVDRSNVNLRLVQLPLD